MSYQTPKTDWTVEDGVSTADINRWEGNTKAIKDEDLTFSGDKTFEGSIIQAWGYDGILNRPSVISGMGTILTRSDSTIKYSTTDDDYHTIKTLTLNQFFPTSSTITIYWQDYSDFSTAGEHDVRLLVNGSQYYENENEDGGYFTRTISNVPAGPNYTYTIQMRSSTTGFYTGDLYARYFRLWCAETIVLTTWEKAAFGLSG